MGVWKSESKSERTSLMTENAREGDVWVQCCCCGWGVLLVLSSRSPFPTRLMVTREAMLQVIVHFNRI
jgi:hypothetical protein